MSTDEQTDGRTDGQTHNYSPLGLTSGDNKKKIGGGGGKGMGGGGLDKVIFFIKNPN